MITNQLSEDNIAQDYLKKLLLFIQTNNPFIGFTWGYSSSPNEEEQFTEHKQLVIILDEELDVDEDECC